MPIAVRPTKVRDMTEAEVAWLAGLIEGEGSFVLYRSGRDIGKCAISMGSTDRDILERLVAITGAGKIQPVAINSMSPLARKPFAIWKVYAQADVRRLCELVRPWLGQRRGQQCDVVLARLADLQTVREGHCARGHELTPANRRSNGGCKQCRREGVAA